MGEHPVESVASQASPRQSVLSLTLARSDSSTASDVVVEEQQLTSWDDFSLAYSQGQWTSAPSLPPSASTAFPPESTPRWFGTIPPEPWRSSPLGTPQAALGLYQEKGYLSAIHGPYEEERRRVVRRFGLDTFGRRAAIDTIAALAQARFQCPVVVVSIVLDDRNAFVSSIGWDEHEKEDDFPRLEFPLETALCAHAMTRLEGSPCLVLEDAREDWRFAKNPYVRDGGPVTFFASANVHLPTSTPPASASGALSSTSVITVPKRLPVGSVCIIDHKPRTSFSAQDAMVLNGLAELVGREIQLAFEEKRESAAARQTAWLGEFLRKSLVQPGLPPSAPSPPSSPSPTIPTAPALELSHAAESLRSLLNADTSAILDLRAFNAPFAPSDLASVLHSRDASAAPRTPNESSRPGLRRGTTSGSTKEGYSSDASRWGATLSGLAAGGGKISVLGTGGGYEWEDAVKGPGTTAAISHSLVAFYNDGICEFDSGTIPSPLGDLLPPQTTASLTLPVFDFDGKPVLFLILCSYTPHFQFDSADRQYLENVGAVAVGSLLRRRVLEADQAKLAFVSQVSHELRTPLHGIGSQLELIRTLSSPAALKVIDPLLVMAEVCTTSLREILDDTLAFAKITNADPSPPSAPRDLQEVELEELVEDVLKSCWARKHQRLALEGSREDKEEEDQVDLVLEMDQTLEGCWAKVDVGGLKRLLFNLTGNALKFTERGSITVFIGLKAKPRVNTLQMVTIKVIDTGIGMSDEFITDYLFLPFKQQDPFSPGAGLGLSICSTIVKRMGGTLHFESSIGAGTVAVVSLPLELVRPALSPRGVPSSASSSHGATTRRIISDELKLLLDPAQLAANAVETAPSSPGSEETVSIPSTAPSPTATPMQAARPSAKSPLKVLVVDDNAIGRKILATFLKAKRVDFREAENGLEAVEIFKSYRPNLVWCDVQMPVMDGIEATAQMRNFEAEHNLPPSHIVAISGLSNDTKTHLAVVETGQINEWLVKGGPTLKLLGEGLLRRQQELDDFNSRLRAAASLEAAAFKLRSGGAIDERLMMALRLAEEEDEDPSRK